MIVRNPSENDVSIRYQGTDYSVEAGGSVNVSDEVALHWRKIHGFLVLEDGVAPVSEEVIEPVAEEAEEVEETEEKEAEEGIIKKVLGRKSKKKEAEEEETKE